MNEDPKTTLWKCNEECKSECTIRLITGNPCYCLIDNKKAEWKKVVE